MSDILGDRCRFAAKRLRLRHLPERQRRALLDGALLARAQASPVPFSVVVETVVIVVAPAALLFALSFFGLHPAVLMGRISTGHQLPPNIRTPTDLRPVIEDALARSATLRQQCVRIGLARKTWVSISISVGRFPSLARARSTARRYPSGLLVVDIEIPPASHDFAELLAHELEHVTEFIDGVDFTKAARSRNAGVVQCGSDGAFESERAQKAGLRAKFEVAMAPGAKASPR